MGSPTTVVTLCRLTYFLSWSDNGTCGYLCKQATRRPWVSKSLVLGVSTRCNQRPAVHGSLSINIVKPNMDTFETLTMFHSRMRRSTHWVGDDADTRRNLSTGLPSVCFRRVRAYGGYCSRTFTSPSQSTRVWHIQFLQFPLFVDIALSLSLLIKQTVNKDLSPT